MKKMVCVMRFMATETLQNGSERRCIRKVYASKDELHKSVISRMESAIALLKENHYYDIEFVDMTTKLILVVD